MTGIAQVGKALVADPGTWTNAPTTFTYQWKLAGISIGGATTFNYVPVIADIGQALTVSVIAANGVGGSEPATSSATSAVIPPEIPGNTVAPSILGIGQVGRTLTVVPGTWTNSPTGLSYRWNKAGIPIVGATGTTYVIDPGDFASSVTITETATNMTGSGVATSALSQFGVYRGTLGGGTATLLAGDATHELNHARRSPDGTHICWTKYYLVTGGGLATETSNYRDTEIILYNATTGVQQVIAAHNLANINAGPSWFPDGSLIWTTDATPSGRSGIAKYDLGSGVTSIYYDPPTFGVSDPEMNYQGTAIALVGNGAGANSIWILASGTLTRLTVPAGGATDKGPHWSKDGTKLALTRQLGTVFSIVVVTVGAAPTFTNIGEVVIAVPGSAAAFDGPPTWLPNGSKLATWHTDQANIASNGLYVMNPDGTGRTQITTQSELAAVEPYFFTFGLDSSSIAEVLFGATLQPIFPAIPVNSAAPVVSGTAQEGQVLMATTGVWSNMSGVGPVTYAYQWESASVNATGAGAATANYTVATADIGNRLTVTVIATNSGGTSAPATSALTPTVIPSTGGGGGDQLGIALQISVCSLPIAA